MLRILVPSAALRRPLRPTLARSRRYAIEPRFRFVTRSARNLVLRILGLRPLRRMGGGRIRSVLRWNAGVCSGCDIRRIVAGRRHRPSRFCPVTRRPAATERPLSPSHLVKAQVNPSSFPHPGVIPHERRANKSVNGTPKCCAFGFPRLRLGARYVQR